MIAGWRRIKAFELLGRTEIPCNHINLTDLRKGEVQENMVRKDFTISEMVAVKRALEPKIKEEHPVGRPENAGKFPELKVGHVRDVLGSFVGVSGKTLEKAEIIVEAAEKEPEKFGALLHVELVWNGRRRWQQKNQDRFSAGPAARISELLNFLKLLSLVLTLYESQDPCSSRSHLSKNSSEFTRSSGEISVSCCNQFQAPIVISGIPHTCYSKGLRYYSAFHTWNKSS